MEDYWCSVDEEGCVLNSKNNILSREQYKLELHVHTKYSHDSNFPFWLLHLMCRLRKITHIAITEHNNIRGGIAFKEYCRKRGEKINVIVGEEIMTNEGEIIGLFLEKEIEAGLSPEETINKIKEQNGIVYVPHPYDEKRYKTVLTKDAIRRNKKKIDFIECHNGRNISKDYDVIQNIIADTFNIKKIIGSDAHVWFEIGRNYIVTGIEPISVESFKLAIKDSVFLKKDYLKIAHCITKFDRVLKLFLKGDIYGLYRFIYKKFRRKM